MDIINACGDHTTMRAWVKEKLHISPTEQGDLWLPLVLTARGVLYAEAIAKTTNGYQQPYHLNDRQRQPLYYLGFKLLEYLNATPAVYLMQFSFKESELLFDRLIPFPDQPAIASVGVQEPDLFECHLLCTTNQPIYDLVIATKNHEKVN